jgi:triphosphatase
VYGSEVELKLAFRREDLAHLRQWPRLDSPKRAEQFESTYYDTADLRLRRAGTELRVRRIGRRFVQTVKTVGEDVGGIRRRGEWETDVAGMSPELGSLSDQVPAVLRDGIAADELQPVFQSRVRRTRQNIALNGGGETTQVEIALDEGEIVTPAGLTLPITEVELELKDGSPRGLYDLALELRDIAPAQLESRSKSERGYALIGAEPDEPVAAPELALLPDMTVEQTLAAIVGHCLAHLRANERIVAAAESPRAVHQMRVSLRRLRSGLQLFRKQLPDADYQRFVAEIRWLGAALGRVRNWDVFCADVLPDAAPALTPAESAALEAGATARRAEAFAELREIIASPRYTGLLLELGAWTMRRDWRNQPISEEATRLFAPIDATADRLLEQLRRKAKKRGAGFDHLSSRERHSLRIALKKLRYAGEFFIALYDEKEVRRYLGKVVALQDRLGSANDVETAEHLVHEIGASGMPNVAQGAGKLLGWHRRGLAEAHSEIGRTWRRLRRADPFWPAA